MLPPQRAIVFGATSKMWLTAASIQSFSDLNVLEFMPREVGFGSERSVFVFEHFCFFHLGEEVVGEFPGGDDFVNCEEVFFAAAEGFADEEGVFAE